MYVNQNKLILIIIILVITNIGNANPTDNQTNPSIIIVGLSKHKVVIMDETSAHKVLNIGDTTTGGLQLISSSSSVAVFKNENGQLISMGITNQISAAYNYNQDEFNNEMISLNQNNQYETIISIEGKEAKGIIDTGANFVTINKNIAAQLNISYKKEENKVQVNTANDKTNGYKVILSTIKLGDIELHNIEAVIMDNDQPETVLIGMSFLKNLDIKYSGDRLKLKKHQEHINIDNSVKANSNVNTNQNQNKTTPSAPK